MWIAALVSFAVAIVAVLFGLGAVVPAAVFLGKVLFLAAVLVAGAQLAPGTTLRGASVFPRYRALSRGMQSQL